jgi:transcriptional regulator GlxA family with amidase domain
MAKALGVTLRFLERFFRTRFGTGPHDWMVRVRMRHAASLITEGVPVEAVSLEVGYKQLSHFSREFKRFFGVPPRSYAFVDQPADCEVHQAVRI